VLRGLDIIKLTKIPLIYSVSCFNLGGISPLVATALSQCKSELLEINIELHVQQITSSTA